MFPFATDPSFNGYSNDLFQLIGCLEFSNGLRFVKNTKDFLKTFSVFQKIKFFKGRLSFETLSVRQVASDEVLSMFSCQIMREKEMKK